MFGFKKKKMDFDELPQSVQEELELVEITMMEGGDPIEIFRRVSKKYPKFIPARLNLATTLLGAGKSQEAKSIYQKIIKEYPDEIGAVAGLATVFDEEGDHSEAEKLANKAIEGGYNWPPCYEVIAKAKEYRGDIQGSAESYLNGYKLSPHSWNYLEEYCRITNQNFTAPNDDVEPCISLKQLESLISSIEDSANKPDEAGNIAGCNHTFRFAEDWAEKNKIDIIQLYQYLNANGGFCDCEICFNVSELLHEECEDET